VKTIKIVHEDQSGYEAYISHVKLRGKEFFLVSDLSDFQIGAPFQTVKTTARCLHQHGVHKFLVAPFITSLDQERDPAGTVFLVSDHAQLGT